MSSLTVQHLHCKHDRDMNCDMKLQFDISENKEKSDQTKSFCKEHSEQMSSSVLVCLLGQPLPRMQSNCPGSVCTPPPPCVHRGPLGTKSNHFLSTVLICFCGPHPEEAWPQLVFEHLLSALLCQPGSC